MVVLILIMFILFFLADVFLIVKAFTKKDNNMWVILYSFNIAIIISTIITGIYSTLNDYLDWNVLVYLVFCIISFGMYAFLLIVSTIFKIIEIISIKTHSKVVKKLDKNKIVGLILIPACLVLFITFLVCLLDFTIYNQKAQKELKSHNETKKVELDKMRNFLNKKYDLNLTKDDCTYYREEDYTRHSDIFGSGKTYNIPFIAVYNSGGKKITVADRKGFISDNFQLDRINYMIADYFTNKTGVKVEYVDFQKSYGGYSCGDDNVISAVLQTKYNLFLDEENINEFVDLLLNEKDLSITFYIKNDPEFNNAELKEKITNELQYLKSYPNIEQVTVFEYVNDLIVKHEDIPFPDKIPSTLKEYKPSHGVDSDDYSDGYKFGCNYVNDDLNIYNYSLSMILDRGYSVPAGEEINGFRYKVFTK